MAPKKQKAQKMALGDFFADTATGSWADDVDDFLPTAPAAKDPSAPKRGEPGYLDAMPDRGSRFSGAPQERADVPLPTAPPYTVYVGNLTFETDESELKDFFGDLKPVTSRLVKADGKSKGFGYVEFSDVEKLKQALEYSGTQLGGRTVRISIAEAPSSRSFAPSAAEEASQWRRTGPLPVREPPPSARRGQSFTSSPMDGGAGGGGERDWGAARGARFTPSPQVAPSSQFGRESRENSMPGRARDEMPQGPSHADEASAWRSSKPLIDVRAAEAPGRASEQSSPGLADTESTWSRGTKLRTPVTEAPTRSATGSPVEKEWRNANPAADSRQGSVDGTTPSDSPRIPAAPLERRKLNLAPRSAASPTIESPKVNSPTTRSSIFGGAQPIDSAAKEAAAAEKLKQQASERRIAAQKAKDDEERKVKEFAEQREKMIRDALAGAGVPSTPAAPERGSAGGDRGRGGFRGGRGGGAPGRQPSGDRPPRPQPAQAQAPPVKPAAAKRVPSGPVVDADGFEVAKGKGKAAAPVQSPTSPTEGAGAGQPRKEVKKGFSFSAAVAQGGFAEEADEGKGESNGESNGVEEARKGVEDVTV